MVTAVQRAESLAIALASVYFYNRLGQSWWQFILLWIALDLSILGYVMNNHVGARVYNLVHNYTVPAALLVYSFYADASDTYIAVALIWFSHVSFDRFLGYGLKLDKGFHHTHLGKIEIKK